MFAVDIQDAITDKFLPWVETVFEGYSCTQKSARGVAMGQIIVPITSVLRIKVHGELITLLRTLQDSGWVMYEDPGLFIRTYCSLQILPTDLERIITSYLPQNSFEVHLSLPELVKYIPGMEEQIQLRLRQLSSFWRIDIRSSGNVWQPISYTLQARYTHTRSGLPWKDTNTMLQVAEVCVVTEHEHVSAYVLASKATPFGHIYENRHRYKLNYNVASSIDLDKILVHKDTMKVDFSLPPLVPRLLESDMSDSDIAY